MVEKWFEGERDLYVKKKIQFGTQRHLKPSSDKQNKNVAQVQWLKFFLSLEMTYVYVKYRYNSYTTFLSDNIDKRHDAIENVSLANPVNISQKDCIN